MPASFEDFLTIVVHQNHVHQNVVHEELNCLEPEGPLKLDPGDEVLRLDIWVFQKKEGAACVAVLSPPPPIEGKTWKANPDPGENHFGNGFQPGPAIGMGLMVKKNANGEIVVEQWEKPITLRSPAEGESARIPVTSKAGAQGVKLA